MEEQIQRFFDRVNIACVIDHSGRAGNSFFLTIFDQHPEVISCPWMHYTYSYLITEFGDSSWIDAQRALSYLVNKYFFKLIYNDIDEDKAKLITKFGGDPTSEIDRQKVKEVFNGYLLKKDKITRKELILLIYVAYAIGINRDINKAKYILVSDAPSLRYEDVLRGFSGKIIPAIKADFPTARFIHLVRDPRAVFASSRHQFVNSQGNIYGIKFGNYFKELKDLLFMKLRMGKGCVYLYWLVYMASTANIIYSLKRRYKESFMTIKNEDLNIRFLEAIRLITEKLGVTFLNDWNKGDYHPTMLGKPWAGMGAYNNRYQVNKYGPLQNDTDDIANKSIGPNVYVTQRWKIRLKKNEIKILEILFAQELKDLSYEFLYQEQKYFTKARFLWNVLFPFAGEVPNIGWVKKGAFISESEVIQRFFYLFSCWPFYILGRLQLIRLYLRNFFDNQEIHNPGESKK